MKNEAPESPDKAWTTEDRKIFLLSHNAPKNMLLITTEEMLSMREHMVEMRKTVDDATRAQARIAGALGAYWTLTGNIIVAVKQVVFDADRYGEVVKKAVPILKVEAKRLRDAIKLLDPKVVSPVVIKDLIDVASALSDRVAAIEIAQDKRLDLSGRNGG